MEYCSEASNTKGYVRLCSEPSIRDEVSIYSRALTAAEIEGIYNAGGAGKCKARLEEWTEQAYSINLLCMA
jgi:hypothetical protein